MLGATFSLKFRSQKLCAARSEDSISKICISVIYGSFHLKFELSQTVDLGALPTVHKSHLDKFVSQFFNDFKVLDSDRCDD